MILFVLNDVSAAIGTISTHITCVNQRYNIDVYEVVSAPGLEGWQREYAVLRRYAPLRDDIVQL
jgi:hypothetical protein